MIVGVAFGRFYGLYFPVPGVVGCFVGCARMRVLGVGFLLWLIGFLCWLCPYVGV